MKFYEQWFGLLALVALRASAFVASPLSLASTQFEPTTAVVFPPTTQSIPSRQFRHQSPGGSISIAQSMTSSQLHHHSPETHISSLGILEALPQSAVFWSSAIMLSIVMLLYVWEELVKSAREKLPPTLLPVVDSMLGEMGGLGFIGLILGVFVTDGPLGSLVGEISEHFLGEEEILLESFEFLHTAFFEVGVGFFLISGLTVARVLDKIRSLQDFSQAVFDRDADGNVCLEELADVLQVDTVKVDLDGNGDLTEEEISRALRETPRPTLLEELSITAEQCKAEALVVRERFLRTCSVSKDFRIETYFTRVFSHNLEEIVELSPLTWLPLIPAISLGRSVDLSREVVSAASPNAYESSGFFLASPAFSIASSAFAFVGLVWGLFNFWKMKEMKDMLVPALVRDSKTDCQATLLPPRYEDEQLMEEFNSSPSIFGWIESFFGKPARNDQERLFGAAGAAGPSLYRNSIKFHSWLIVSQLVFWGTQIVARDASALIRGVQVGNPDLLVPELLLYSLYVASAIGQLILLAPQTFLNYCLVTSIEDLVMEKAVFEACDMDLKAEKEKISSQEATNNRPNGASVASR